MLFDSLKRFHQFLQFLLVPFVTGRDAGQLHRGTESEFLRDLFVTVNDFIKVWLKRLSFLWILTNAF